MAEMELDDLARGSTLVNMERYGREALEAASKAGGKFIEQQPNSDCATWNGEQWDKFIWSILAAGIYEAIHKTTDARRKILEGIDEIPY